MEIKRLLAVNVPIKNCNLKCQYCYISALDKSKQGPAKFEYSPEHVGKCLSKERLGGVCIINLTGGGETLIPEEMPKYIYELLLQGHYLEVVTNGTLTKRFEEIALFPKELLNRLEFKFSFHYAELLKRDLLEKFFANVKMMESCGCSYTVELMPYDEIMEDIPQIVEMCKKYLGARCQLTVGRNDLTKGKELLTSLSKEQYEKVWQVFESTMFAFKLSIFDRKITEFCYAGEWTLYIDLGTGAAKPCYGQISNQNIFEDPNRPIIFEPVGHHCRQPYCYNGHAFLTMGVVPELETPTYADIRNRIKEDGTEWLQKDLKIAFSQKLSYANEIWSNKKKMMHEILFPFRFIKTAVYGRDEIIRKVFKRNK
ncbi:MAG: radical SAM protein [Roseburia sp.]|nr:radical SAM protein [Roseburia sp.]